MVIDNVEVLINDRGLAGPRMTILIRRRCSFPYYLSHFS
jgi:hypothetical protein